MLMINKNPLSLNAQMSKSKLTDVLNSQTQELEFPLECNAKFSSGGALDCPIKLQVAFRNEFDD